MINKKDEISYEEKIPTADEYNNITNEVGWGSRSNEIVEKALNNSLYSICAYDKDKLIGYGRIIGDETIFLYIQDIMVIPKYQSQKIGTNIMKRILEKVEKLKKVNPNIRTYLGATKGKEEFYRKFNFVSRKEAGLGEGMILK